MVIQLDAHVLGDLLGGRVQRAGKCLNEDSLTCALHSKSTWKCIPSIWTSAAQFCDDRSKRSNSMVSMGILVAGAVLSHAVRNKKGDASGASSTVNLHPRRQETGASQMDKRKHGFCVQMSGNQQTLVKNLQKAVGK